MKRIVLVLMVLLALTVTSGVWASSTPESEQQLHIGVAAANFDDKWMSYMHDGFREAAEAAGVRITMVDGKNDPAVQQSQIETFITQGVDAIVIVPVQPSTMGPILDATDSADIPLVAVNRFPEEPLFSRLATYVGSNEVYAGTVQAETICELLGGKGSVVIMNGELGHPGMIGRTQGNKDVIAKYPDITIVRENTAEWSRAKGLELMENWIQSGVQIDAVLANNDEMAIVQPWPSSRLVCLIRSTSAALMPLRMLSST
jgi:inositol transport system substrate-binding protein